MSRSWLLYLDDLIESAEKIARLTAGRTFSTFTSDEAAFDAVPFNLQVIGEAIKRLPEDARAAMPGVIESGLAKSACTGIARSFFNMTHSMLCPERRSRKRETDHGKSFVYVAFKSLS